MSAIPYLILALMAFGTVAINVHDRRHRARMTPEERKREDEETKIEAQIW